MESHFLRSPFFQFKIIVRIISLKHSSDHGVSISFCTSGVILKIPLILVQLAYSFIFLLLLYGLCVI